VYIELSRFLWNTYERVVQDLPRSNNAVEDEHHEFNNRVLIKHLSIAKLTTCILREHSRFQTNIERLRASEQPKKKLIYSNLAARLKKIAMFYDVNDIEEYFTPIAMNLKISTRI
jgi:hypothetical protein